MSEMLVVSDIHTFYDQSYILQGISFKVNKGSVVGILGRNGMGKTTIIRSIIGLTPPRSGTILFKGENIVGLPAYKIGQMGIGLVPQGRHIFPSLSVKENLTMAARNIAGTEGWHLERVYSTFPILKNRANIGGNRLSGGEQQMLCIARALMVNPDLLLLDEPSEGLAPLMVREIGNIVRQLKASGFSILLVEQNLSMALGLADYIYVINKGKTVYESTPEELRNNAEILGKYLGAGE
jgi:branched-chain amino acid transport system ATP-binding protein